MEESPPAPSNSTRTGSSAPAETAPAATVAKLSLATDQHLEWMELPATTNSPEPSQLKAIEQWVGASADTASPRDSGTASHYLAFQGVEVWWSSTRAGAIAPAQRLTTVRETVHEFSRRDAELRSLEREVEALWPLVQQDAALAFEFSDAAIRRRAELGQRFQQTVSLRARHARLAPHVHRPPLHPATLASQIAERLRERSRLVERWDFLTHQLEVIGAVYEQCASRASEYLSARKGHQLEWVIIVILAAQTVLFLVERLASSTS